MKNDTKRCSQFGLWARAISAVFAALLALSIATPAQAAGRVVWKQTTLKENVKRERWKLELEFHLNRPPDVAYVPMKFEFKPTAYYERSLVDGREEPQLRTVPLTNQQALIETFEVGFYDAGTGEIQKRTRFSVKITRAHDFEAGEYTVTIKNGNTGARIGGATRIRLTGENPVIDRRSIVFHGKKKKSKEEAEEKTEEPEEQPAEEAPVEEAAPEPEPAAEEAAQEPPSVDERPGGGCHHGPSHGTPWMTLGVLLAAAGLVLSRRRT